MVGTVLSLPCDMENHASYIQSWLGVLREDKRAVFRAAALAQKAADWMLALHPDYARMVAGDPQAGGEGLDEEPATPAQADAGEAG
jgi:antirestriction protein ArdC